MAQCCAYQDIRQRIFPEYSNVCEVTKSNVCFEDVLEREDNL